MLWLLLALGSRFLFACTNVLSSHFRDHFPTGYTQLFFLSLYGTVLAPLLFLIIHPAIPHGETWLWLAIVGFFTSVYTLPYFEALRVADTSVVASLYAFNRVLTPLVAYALIGEKLSPHEWLGLMITIPGGLLATYEPKQNLRFNFKALWLMILSSLGLALLLAIAKLAYREMSGIDGFCYIYLFSIMTSWGFVFIPRWRPVILENLKHSKTIIKSYGVQPFISIMANLTLFVALSMTKASYVAVIGQFQPFFVLIIIALLHRMKGFNAREGLAAKLVLQKVAAFLIMSTGVAIMLLGRQG